MLHFLRIVAKLLGVFAQILSEISPFGLFLFRDYKREKNLRFNSTRITVKIVADFNWDFGSQLGIRRPLTLIGLV